MYKLVIGSVKITVASDDIPKNAAIEAASRQIANLKKQNKYLDHISMTKVNGELELDCKESDRALIQPKTLRQSLLDSIVPTMRDKFANPALFAPKDSWRDNDTGQEWRGSEVTTACDGLIEALEQWIESEKEHKNL